MSEKMITHIGIDSRGHRILLSRTIWEDEPQVHSIGEDVFGGDILRGYDGRRGPLWATVIFLILLLFLYI